MLNQTNSFILIIIAIVLLIFLYVLVNSKKPKLNKAKYTNNLDVITKLINYANYQSAVMESDKLLDSALKELGVNGSTMGERLRNCGNLGLNLNDIWWAHKLRNRVAHEVGYNISATNANKVVKILKTSLKKLGAI